MFIDNGLLYRFELLSLISVNLSDIEDTDRFYLLIDILEAASQSDYLNEKLYSNNTKYLQEISTHLRIYAGLSKGQMVINLFLLQMYQRLIKTGHLSFIDDFENRLVFHLDLIQKLDREKWI